MSPFPAVTWDDSLDNLEEGGFAGILVRDGEYLLKISQVGCSPENHTGKAFISPRWEIVKGPDGIGRRSNSVLTLATNGQRWLGSFLVSIGSSPEQLRKILPNGIPEGDHRTLKALAAKLSSKAAGKLVGATLAQESYDGKMQSRVQFFYPPEKYEERAQHQATALATANAPSQQEVKAAAEELDGVMAEL